MSKTYNVLIMGASYGSLLAAKLLAASHSVRLVCLPPEAELFNEDGARIPNTGGILPDVQVKQPEKWKGFKDKQNDLQLKRALEALEAL